MPAPHQNYTPVSIEAIHRKADFLKLRLIGQPHREGHVFIAFAEDSHRVLHHLVFDAEAGTLLENGTVSGKPKSRDARATAAKPATSASSANLAQKPKTTAAVAKPATPAAKSVAAIANPATAAAKPAAPAAKSSVAAAKPVKAAATPTVAANKDLSPIKPEPAWMSGPTPNDPNIDKD
jgi:hypothetical protein